MKYDFGGLLFSIFMKLQACIAPKTYFQTRVNE